MTILYDSLLSVCFLGLVSFVLMLLLYYKGDEGYVLSSHASALSTGWTIFLPILIYRGLKAYLMPIQKIMVLLFTLTIIAIVTYNFYNRLVVKKQITVKDYIRNWLILGVLVAAYLSFPYSVYALKVTMALLTIIAGVLLIVVQKVIKKNNIQPLWMVVIVAAMALITGSIYLEYHHHDLAIKVLQFIGSIIFYAGLAVNYADTNERASRHKIDALERQNRKLFEAEVQVLKYAYKDQVTGLPNYSSFQSTVRNNLKRTQNREAYLMFMDLDDFRRVNAVVGFAEGNDILKKCGDLVANIMPPGDNLFRINGSRFALVHYGSMTSSQALARSIIGVINGADELRTNAYFRQGVSIGITLIDQKRDFNTIINQAEIAMYKVKEHKKNDYEFFNDIHEKAYKNLLELEGKLKNAAKENVWSVYLQPQVDVATGKINALEALIRWFDGERYIPPDEFIPLAEKNGLIVRIGDDVIQKVFSLMQDFQKKQILDIKFSVNVSAVEMFDTSFVERISRYIETYNVNPANLTLELTETAILENVEEAQAIMEELRSMNLSLSIDDFGSGFTSLSYLSRLPIDEVKIDKGYIDHIVDNGKDRILLGHFTELCHDLGLKVVAEGIETKAQLEYITGIGCDAYQGYYFSKPLSYEKIVDSFSKNTSYKTS